MPELRYDPTQKRWVILAPERSARPYGFGKMVGDQEEEVDPFLAGNEIMTPPEVYAVRPEGSKPDSSDWSLRVVPNKYPALKVEGNLFSHADGIYDFQSGIGAHEVIIETPDPEEDLALLPSDRFLAVLMAVQDRMIDLSKDQRLKQMVYFRNHGRRAGASLHHPHSQLIATSVVPKSVDIKLDAAQEYYQTRKRCVYCDIIHEEIRKRKRIILDHDHYVAIAPYASRFPFEVMIMPKEHQSDFGKESEKSLAFLVEILQEVLIRLRISLENPSYNMILQTSPNTQSHLPHPANWGTMPYHYHWHIELMPRLEGIAAFELGTGMYINSTPPEQAAKILREVDI